MTTLCPRVTGDWRAWLAQNCRSGKEIWLVIYHARSGTPGVRYHEAIEHALCYGWIDSHARKRDTDSCYLRDAGLCLAAGVAGTGRTPGRRCCL